MNDAEVLLELAGAVADGERIEWDVAMRHLGDGRSRTVAGELRQIAENSAATAEGSLTGATAAGRPRIPWLARMVVVLGAGHVLLGLAAYAAGRVPAGAFLPAARLGTAVALAAGGLALYAAGRDERARWLGAVFVALSSGPALSFAGGLVPPAWARRGVAAALVPLPDCLFPWLLWSFVKRFPTVVRFDRLERVLDVGGRLSLALGLLLAAANAAAALSQSDALHALLRENRQGLFWVASFAGSLAPLVIMCARIRVAAPGERRRVAWFVAGVLVGLGPLLLLVAGDALVPAVGTWLDRPRMAELVGLTLYAFEATLPATVGYAVFARRLLPARLVLQRALQAALARSALAAATLVPAGVLAVLLWTHRTLPVGEILGGGLGRAMAVLLGVSVLLLVWQRPIGALIERRLGSPIADPSIALSRLAHAARASETIEEALLHCGEIAGSAVGAKRSVLLAATGGVLRPIPGSTGRSLPLDSAIVSVLGHEGDATVLGAEERRSLFAWIPERERQWVVDSEVAVLAPVRDPAGSLVAAVGLGPHRSGAPYTGGELNFVAAAAAAIGVAVPRGFAASAAIAPGDPEAPARECPACERVAPAGEAFCPECAAPTTEAALPHVVNGKYRVRRVLGRGGMGVVYLAEDLGLGREVALKTLPRVSAAALVRLRVEARAMASVAGPHLATIHALESWRGVPILAVEHLAGGTLAARARRPLAFEEVRTIAVAMAQALAAMHARGLVHGDVKPSNIGFAADGTPKLLDFGLVRLVRGSEPAADSPPREDWISSQTGRWMGTLLYLSPERLHGRAPSPGDDLWALSVSCLECLLGRHPLRGAEARLRTGDMPPNVAGGEDLADPAQRDFFRRALSPDPRLRFGSALEFVEVLTAPSRRRTQ